MMNMDDVSWLSLPFAASPWPVQVAVNLAFAAVIWGMVWWFITKQASSTGKTFSEDIWPAIKDDPKAVVLYRLGVYALALGTAWIAFGGFK
jgi:hypothetical protein